MTKDEKLAYLKQAKSDIADRMTWTPIIGNRTARESARIMVAMLKPQYIEINRQIAELESD